MRMRRSKNIVLALWVAAVASAGGSARAQASLPLYESFDSPGGSLLVGRTVGGGTWTRSGIDTLSPVTVTTGSLAYPGIYPQGHKVILGNGSNQEDAGLDIAGQNSGTVYASFLLKVINAGNTTGDYVFHFSSAGTGATNFRSRVHVKQGSSAGKFVVGLNNISPGGTPVWTSTEYDVGTEVLIAVAYALNPGSADDMTYLWVNPSLHGTTPPPPDLNQPASADLGTLGRVGLRQGSGNAALQVQVDELRVSTSWSDVTLPVALSRWGVE